MLSRFEQRWSPRGRSWPRGHILKSLALDSKVKSLASKSQVLENYPVLGSRIALFFEWLNFCRSLEKCFDDLFFSGDRLKKIFEDIFLFENTCVCILGPWPREGLSSEELSSALTSDFFVSLALASSLMSSTPPLGLNNRKLWGKPLFVFCYCRNFICLLQQWWLTSSWRLWRWRHRSSLRSSWSSSCWYDDGPMATGLVKNSFSMLTKLVVKDQNFLPENVRHYDVCATLRYRPKPLTEIL